MKEDIIFHLYYDDFFREVDPEDIKKDVFTLGSSEDDDIFIDSKCISEEHAVFEKFEDEYIIKDKKNNGIFCNGRQIKSKAIIPGDILFFSSVEGKTTQVAVLVNKKSEYDGVYETFNIEDLSEITLGRNKDSNIIFQNRMVSDSHARIYFRNGGYHAADMNSTNGVFVNGKKIRDSVLEPGDIITICGYRLIFCDKSMLRIENVGNGLLVKGLSFAKPAEASYPYFHRSPRLEFQLPEGEIEIPAPPQALSKPNISWIPIILPPIAMMLVTILSTVWMKSGTSYLLFTLPMTFVTFFVSIFSYISQRNRFAKDEKLRIERYQSILTKKREDIQVLWNKQKDVLIKNNPDIDDCLSIASERSARLWERNTYHEDFLHVRLGRGVLPFNVKIKITGRDFNLQEDNLLKEAQKIEEDFRYVKDCPLTIPLVSAATCGIIGDKKSVLELARSLIVNISTHHSYDEVKIVSVYSEEISRDFEWMRWLPHVWDENMDRRFMAKDRGSVHQMFSELLETVKLRELQLNDKNESGSVPMSPHYVFLIENVNLVENEPLMIYLTKNNMQLGISAIFISDSIESLPGDCRYIVYLKEGGGNLLTRENSEDVINFKPDSISIEDADAFARNLAPVRIKHIANAGTIPKTVPLFDLFGADKVEELQIENRWNSNEPYNSLSTPIGVKAGGYKLFLDINDNPRSNGPHGLIAGTIGSGKSEFLQSFILSMAINFHPHYVNFLLIDYKGGGMANFFKDLPHLSGIITNLAGNEIDRALISIKSELLRRQEILNKYGVNHIDKYLSLYKRGKAGEPLPHLIIICDEFAELKAEKPNFIGELISAVRIGRSLGVHLILATQKPSGVVDDQIWSNSKFKVCFKVQDSADSMEVLKRADAASIRLPGRAYLQVGNNEMFEMFQSAWSGAEYISGKGDLSQKGILEVKLDGTRSRLNTNIHMYKKREYTSQLDAVVRYIISAAEKENIKPLKSQWLPPLPANINLNDILDLSSYGWDGLKWRNSKGIISPVIGMVDNPVRQEQFPLELNIEKEGHAAIYGAPGSGKTTLLKTLVMSLAYSYSPDELSIYIMDFGGRTLNIFSELPHVGGVVLPDEEDKFEKLMKMMLKELDRRKRMFAERGIGSIAAYNNASQETIRAYVLIIDNYSAVKEMYPDAEDFFVQLCREGGNPGIHVILTANSSSVIGYKLNNNIKVSLALHMTDRSEYAGIVGNTNGMELAPFAGRGYIKANPPLEFQAAVPACGTTEIETAAALQNVIKSMSDSWKGMRAPKIPVIPELLYFDEIANTPDDKNFMKFNPMAIPIGIDIKEIETVYLNLPQTSHFVIAGETGSGKTFLLNSIISFMIKSPVKDKAEIYIVDSLSMGLFQFKDAVQVKEYINNSSKLAEAVKNISDSLDLRKKALIEERVRTGGKIDEKSFMSNYSQIVLIIDDYNDFMAMADTNTLEILQNIIRRERTSFIHIIVAGITADLEKGWDEFTKALKDLQQGLLFGEAANQQFFNIRISYNKSTRQMKKGEGYVINNGSAKQIKVALYR